MAPATSLMRWKRWQAPVTRIGSFHTLVGSNSCDQDCTSDFWRANFSGNWTAWRTRGCICRLRSIRTTPTGSLQNAEPGATFAFDLRRYPFQEEVLNVLAAEREVQNKFRHLVVAATGTGKTMIAAFEYATLSRQSGTRPPICPARSRFTRNTPVTRSWSAWDTVRWNAGRISERASSTLLNPRRMPPSSLARATISEHESLQAGWFFTV